MNSELILDTKKRDKPCHPDCRHPICVYLKKLNENERKSLKELDYDLCEDELHF